MKRSEMIKKLATAFEEHSDNQQYKGYSHGGLAETFLSLADEFGMYPPERVRYEDLPNGKTLCIPECTWEPEND